MLPTAMPMIVRVLAGLLCDDLEGSDGEAGQDVDASPFPTVDPGRSFAFVALTTSNLSVVVTSRYAQAGTTVSEVILFGYLSAVVNSCLRMSERSNGGRTWILRALDRCNLFAMKTT